MVATGMRAAATPMAIQTAIRGAATEMETQMETQMAVTATVATELEIRAAMAMLSSLAVSSAAPMSKMPETTKATGS